LIFESEGIDCILTRNAGRVAIISSSPLSARIIPQESAILQEIIRENWQGFTDIIQQGPFTERLRIDISSCNH
jgi:hypothetical protein